jgi:hypothetical protein
MPPPIAAIAAGVGAGGGILNSFLQVAQNRKNREFSRGMYDLQREHANQDWHRENLYNHPMNQARRLEQAGLNKALMYGKSASPGLAGSVRSSDFKNPQTQAPQYGNALTYLPQMFDFELKQAQTDNLDQLRKTEAAKTILTAAQASSASTDADIKRATKGVAISTAEAEKQKLDADIKMTLDENERRAMLAGATFKEKLVNVAQTMANTAKTEAEKKRINALIQGIKTDNRIKESEAKLRDSNIYQNDGLLARLIARLLFESGGYEQLKLKLESMIP